MSSKARRPPSYSFNLLAFRTFEATVSSPPLLQMAVIGLIRVSSSEIERTIAA